MGLQYMPLFVGDYHGDTQDLSCEETGAYILLLMTLWRKGGTIPFNERKLATITRLGVKKWRSTWPSLAQFFWVEDGMMASPRLSEVLEKSQTSLSQKRTAGKASALSKVLKKHKPPSTAVPTNQTISKPKDLFGDHIGYPAPENCRQASEEIWAASPTAAKRRSSQAQLTRALEAALNRRKNLAVICQAVAAYYADPEKAKEGHKYAKGVHRVVQDDYWEAWAPGDVEHMPDPEFQAHVWRTWMRDWLESPGQWREYERGPRPDEPGCRIPAEIIAKFQPKTATGRP